MSEMDVVTPLPAGRAHPKALPGCWKDAAPSCYRKVLGEWPCSSLAQPGTCLHVSSAEAGDEMTK